MKYAFYLGCLIPARAVHCEHSAKSVLTALGVDLEYMQDTTCCGPFTVQSLDYLSWLSMAARNICIAEEMNLDILTLCNDCYESLLMANEILKEDEETRGRVNEVLSDVDKEFKGGIDVKHLVEVISEDIGLEKIREAVTHPFRDLRVTTHAGCHLVRPRSLHTDIQSGFQVLDDLVEVTGARVVDYDYKEVCCGGPLKFMEDEISTELTRQKLVSFKRANVQCVVTVCPFCFTRFDLGQVEIRRLFKERYDLPVIYLMELLSLAMNLKLMESDFRWHKIKIDEIVKANVEG
ncbi:MAG: CoB--CoM heterodisulfide reductase subunit B [Nitrososphaeria archaeon]|nr:CoB--CoM heterodisulfide reductase subunit B [Nitrososphaeria archaeon]NIN52460.1 CoB--CoM heterodisulfide reductase subunit B [Nitrososphaeria archaeon]NIQ32966.1 CoB--CoM heterodisulfide reductase subunit B [Nitrososphaeria archaeon]